MLMYRVIMACFMALLMNNAAFAAWHEARSKHFIIYSQQKPEQLRAFAERLERFDQMVRFMRGMEDPPVTEGSKVTLYVLPHVVALQRLYGSTSDGVLGFYMPRASGSVAFVSSRTDERIDGLTADHVIQHEYFHHMMLSDQKVPLAAWMIEGYAEFFGTAEVQRDGSIKVGLPPQSRGAMVLLDLGFNAEQMLSGVAPRNDLERASLYGKGWLLTHYLAFTDTRKGQLDRYVAGLARGEAPAAAARAAFGDLKQLDREIDRYARGTLPARLVTLGVTPQVTIRPLAAGEEAIMPVRIRSERGVNASTAPLVAADARRIAAGFPADPFVQGVLAEAEFDVKDYKAAIAAADRALAVDPKHVQSLIYKGRALMALAKADPAKADWAEVRKWFIRANRADTENAEPLWLFYQTYMAAGVRPPPAAVAGLLYAQVLAPQDIRLRFETVRQLLLDGRVAEAEPLFAQIVFNPHIDVGKRPRLAEVMQKIRARDGQAALTALVADQQRPGAESDEA